VKGHSNSTTGTSSYRSDAVWSHPGTPLTNHLEAVAAACAGAIDAIPLQPSALKQHLVEVARLAGLYHDVGKAAPAFQDYLREQNEQRRALLKNQPETKHSLLSAVATYVVCRQAMRARAADNTWLYYLPVAAFLAVRRHHTSLISAADDLRLGDEPVLRAQWRSLPTAALRSLPLWPTVEQEMEATLDSWPLRKLEFLRWLRDDGTYLPHLAFTLLYSALLDADKHSAAVGQAPPRASVPADLVDTTRAQLGFDRPVTRIAALRNELYDSVLQRVPQLDLESERILSLSAPTGSGKTLTLLSFALKLRDRIRRESGYSPRIIYALPFLSIIDQNAEVVRDMFRRSTGVDPTTDQFLIHHHLSDLSYSTDENECDPAQGEILVEGWDSEVIVTTFVQLFHTLFTNRNRAIRKLHKLFGSIVILDEPQAIPAKYWLLFRETAQALARNTRTFFLLATATQPAIFDQPTELVNAKESYFSSFGRITLKPRTGLKETVRDLAARLDRELRQSKQSTLVVVNTIASAEELHLLLAPALAGEGYRTFYLSTRIVPAERLRRIEEIRRNADLKLVVSTQLVEAGVDIDLERVIRDVAPVDSIIQAAGRANRNMVRPNADVEVVHLVNERGRSFSSFIYDRWLLQPTEHLLGDVTAITEPQLLALAEEYFHRVRDATSTDQSRELLEAVRRLDFEAIGKFELIEDPQEKVDIFVELDDAAKGVWTEFCQLSEVEDRFDRRRAFQQMRGRFFQYVVSIPLSRASQNLPPEVEGVRYVSNSVLEEFYDMKLGFKVEPSVSIW